MSGESRPAAHGEPKSFWERLRTSRLGRRLEQWWVQNHDVVIREGVGKGLRFHAGRGNPDYARGTNELPVQQALARILHPGDVFYDIGANVGFLTVIAARLVGAQGQVIAFEPVPENAAAVRHNCEINGIANVQVSETAISDEIGTASLHVAEYAGGSALAAADNMTDDLKGVMTVAVTTVDALIAQRQAPPPTLVKIDVEGAEINVLRGMRETLSRVRPIVLYEIDDEDAQRLAAKAALCADFLREMGYEIEELEDAYPEIDWFVSHYVAKPGNNPA